MYKNRYQLMANAVSDTDEFGTTYPDLFTLDLSQFIYTKKPVNYKLTDMDTRRFDLLMLKIYGLVDFYDTVVLWLNNITFIDSDTYTGTEIILPVKQDIETFYVNNISGDA